jgi:hypothetical protein
LEQKRIRHIESFATNHPESIEIFRGYFLRDLNSGAAQV